MSIFSRRKRLLNRTPKAPKMSSRRQFHRALRRHPAWPTVMEQAAARAQAAKAKEAAQRDPAGVMLTKASNRTGLRRFALPVAPLIKGLRPEAASAAWRQGKLRRNLRRNRVLVVTLLAVGGLVAVLNGIGGAHHGLWLPGDSHVETVIPPMLPRFGAAAAFDGTREEVLVFGGFSGHQPPAVPGVFAPPPVAYDETWGIAFQDIKNPTNRNPQHRPSARGYASMAYDQTRRNMVLFGGGTGYRTNAVSGETWTWDGVDWTLRNPPEPRPPARQNASMVYDAHRRLVVLFGGRGLDEAGTSLVALNDTWTWNGSAWKKLNPPGDIPLPRHSAAMAYDMCRGEAVMFGGIGPLQPAPFATTLNSISPQPSETWTFNGSTWAHKGPVPSPPGRIGASMSYVANGRVNLYGGFTTTDTGQSLVATDDDVWMWDGTKWEKEIPVGTAFTPAGLLSNGNVAAQPPPRAYAAFASSGGKTYLFGGTPADPNPQPQVALPDHWSRNDNASGIAWDATGTGSNLYDRGLAPEAVTFRCHNPVPIPPADTQVEIPKPPQLIKTQTREEIQEIGRLPALQGTDWPDSNRSPNNPNNTPNPQYTPAPDCPNRNGIGGKPDGPGTDGPANNHLVTDPKRNRVYQFFVCNSAAPNHKVLIQAYDGTTLKPLGSAVAPITTGAQFAPPASYSLLHDADRGRFLYRAEALGLGLWDIRQDLIEQGKNPVFAKLTLPPSPSASGGAQLTQAISAISLFNHPKTGRAKLLISYHGIKLEVIVIARPQIVQWDIDGNRQDVDWRRVVDACNGGISFALTSGMRVGDRVYSSCHLTSGGQAAVVRVPVVEIPNDPVATDGEDSPATLPMEVFPGPFNVGNRVWADPKTERYLLLAEPPYAKVLWQFDGKASAYVGRAGLATSSISMGFGFDSEAGRLYALGPDHQAPSGDRIKTQGGLFVVDTHLTPITQAINFAKFMYPGDPAIATLPAQPGVPRRVFVRRVGGGYPRFIDSKTVLVPQEDHYKVLADLLPLSEPPEIGRLDALTVPVAESAGKTEANFSAEGSGYGIRMRSVGGILSALRAPLQAQAGGTESITDSQLRAYAPICFFSDRELMAGWVSQARLSDLEGSARSLGLDVDSNSKADLEGLSTRCLPASASPYSPVVPPSARPYVNAIWGFLPFAQVNEAVGSGSVATGKDADGSTTPTNTPLGVLEQGKDKDGNPTAKFNTLTGLAWTRHFHEAECTGDSSSVTQTAGADASSSATCKQKDDPKDDWVSGTARGALGPANVGFSVGEGSSDVVVKRDPVKGVVVTSTAEAKDIKLPTGLTIGYVKTEAVAWSNGRPGEGRTSFTRTICNVSPPLPVNPANSDPRAPNTGCLSESQQKQMAADFNARMGVNGKMILPAYDPDFFKGSPGGYIAGVTKPKATEVEDQLLARDAQREVPGLEVVFYKDNNEYAGRQIVLLAAVRAVSGYGVQCASEFIYSSTAKNCLALSFEDDQVTVEEFEEDDVSSDDSAFNSYDDGGAWTPIETDAPRALSLGRRLGQFIENLPVIRRLPIRQMGEALMAASVWMLLGLPLLLASRRFALTLAKRS